ncbi:MAG: TIGR02530 family flagellar biosynthesis protein [Fimbriimonadaceae bacterium]
MSSPIQNNKVADLLQNRSVVQPKPSSNPSAAADFQAVLADRLKVSNHAQTRLQSRDIQMDAAQWERVLDGVEKAALKGAKESLVMIDDIALVVSVRNRTVITAVDQEHLKENVFTNIDSAVIV